MAFSAVRRGPLPNRLESPLESGSSEDSVAKVREDEGGARQAIN